MSTSVGKRIAHIRASCPQRQFAEDLGVPLRTFQNYEQDRREPDQRTLIALYERGWNINWILSGEGQERLDALQQQASTATDADAATESEESQALRQEYLTLAIQAVEDALEARKATLPVSKRAEAVMLVYELLGTGLPEADVIPLTRRAIGLAQEGMHARPEGLRKGIGR